MRQSRVFIVHEAEPRFFDRNFVFFVRSMGSLRPHGVLLAQKMHLCTLKDPYNNAEAHSFSLLYHRHRSEHGKVGNKCAKIGLKWP